jgi:DNA modification methylase
MGRNMNTEAGSPENTAKMLDTAKRKLAIEYRLVASLRPDPKNPRLHDRRQIRQIARSIEAFGFNVPVLINAEQQVIAGHGRLLAAQLLGMTQVPTITLEHLTENQVRAFMIADNRLTENSVWDERLLAEQLKELSGLDLNFTLEATGFEMGEIDVMIEGLAPGAGGDKDPADALPTSSASAPVSRPGDLWVLGQHRVFCGDALSAASYTTLMGSEKATMVFVDLPYNVPIDGHATGLGSIRHEDFAMACGEMTEAEFTDFLIRAFTLLAAYSIDGALHFVCMDWRHMQELLTAGRCAFSELKNVCVWVKDNGGMGSLYGSQHELVFVFKSGKGPHRNNVQLGQYGRYRSNVWQYPGVNSFSRNTEEGNLLELHPTVKPVALVADAILDCSARADIVLDSFLGSGTAVIACERTGRICYGMELSPIYVDTAIHRWQAFTGQKAINESSGQTFAEAEKEGQHG